MTNQLFREYEVEGIVSGNTLEIDASESHTISQWVSPEEPADCHN